MKSKWTAATLTLPVAILMTATLVSGTAAAQNSAGAPAMTPTASPTTPSSMPVADPGLGGPEYVIGPEDVLHVAVWKEADLTATLPVRPDGKISLPLLDDVQAAGLTPKQLADSITLRLKKFIADPRVTVVLSAINSKHIYMVGEVLHSGALPMSPNMTVLQALSGAGLNQFANTKRIYLLRTENGKQRKMPVDYRKIVKGEKIEENYPLQPGDTIVVP